MGLAVDRDKWLQLDLQPRLQDALDTDLAHFGLPILPQHRPIGTDHPQQELLRASKLFEVPRVLQIAALEDAAAPTHTTSTHSDKRLLWLTLTDGHSKIKAVEYEPISELG